MSQRTTRILDLIDAGLQTPMPDPTFGEVSPDNNAGCARCGYSECAEDSDWCQECRAFLLGDTPTPDPRREAWMRIEATAEGILVVSGGAFRYSEVVAAWLADLLTAID